MSGTPSDYAVTCAGVCGPLGESCHNSCTTRLATCSLLSVADDPVSSSQIAMRLVFPLTRIAEPLKRPSLRPGRGGLITALRVFTHHAGACLTVEQATVLRPGSPNPYNKSERSLSAGCQRALRSITVYITGYIWLAASELERSGLLPLFPRACRLRRVRRRVT